MIANVVRDKGGLHNRITKRIHLSPFSLAETEQFLISRNVRMDRYQILILYMALGGIPHYSKEVEAGKSAAQNIDQLCFSKNGILRDEFLQLYPALFESANIHMKIVKALAQSRSGMTRNQVIEKSLLQNNGNTSKILEELELSGFISPFYAFGKKKKDLRYRLSDEYSLFYLKFIEETQSNAGTNWQIISQTQSWKTWSGYAFENLALAHVVQIKKALEIGGIYSEASSFYLSGTKEQQGVQIDLVLVRNDHVINLIELKFYNSELIVTKALAKEFRTKMAIFKAATETNKQLFFVLITPFGLIPNEHSVGMVDRSFDLDVLFE